VRLPRLWVGRRGRGSERGATLVEAAFVFPVLAILAFGLIEFGLVLKDYLTVANMTRSGARTAVATGAAATADYNILQSISGAGNALGSGNLQYVVVFKATAGSSALPSASCQTGSVTGICNYYTAAQLTLAKTNFGNCVNNGDATVDGAWCPVKRVNTLTGNAGAGPDFVGVYIKTVHPYVTKLFGNAITLSDTTVMRIEPAGA
jgi:Flp pilus assembly protein TadG